VARIRITTHRKSATTAMLDRSEGAIVVVAQDGHAIGWADIPYGKLIRDRWLLETRPEPTRPTAPWLTHLPNRIGTRTAVATAASSMSAFELLTLGRKLVDHLLQPGITNIAVIFSGLPPELTDRCAETLVAAALAKNAPLPSYKSRVPPPLPTRTLRLFGARNPVNYKLLEAEAGGNHLARCLTTIPANELTPAQYRRRLVELAADEGWRTRFLGRRVLRQKKAGAFLAVAQGDPGDDDGIMHLRYRPSGISDRPRLALVGKGICFDTGGTNLKSARYMYGMHEDMAGSAVAVGILLSLTRMRAPFAVDCWVALTQNLVGPSAYRPNEVITAANGTTIEVVHTDAEGRMVLADTLYLACRSQPELLIDYATLTGACIEALGKKYSGVFTNRDTLNRVLLEAGHRSGERVWPFPLDSDYDEALESDIADVKQCGLDNEADHILAARFLNRFVDPGVAWVHMDLSAARHKGGLAHVATDVTGFGVRFTLQFLKTYGLLR